MYRVVRLAVSSPAAMAYDAFISYSSRDRSVADDVCRRLEAKGLSCWIAPRDIRPGASWAEGIMQGIDQSRTMILLWTEASNRSKHVHREVQRALDREMVIIPVRLEDVAPAPALTYCLSVTQWYDATVPPLHRHVNELVRLVQSAAGRDASVTAPSRPPVDAPVSARAANVSSRGLTRSAAIAAAALGSLACVVVGAALLVLIWRSQNPDVADAAAPGPDVVAVDQKDASASAESRNAEPTVGADGGSTSDVASPGEASLRESVRAADEKVYEALAKESQFEFYSAPIADVAEMLGYQYSIPVKLDRPALASANLETDLLEVTARTEGIPLAGALRAALRDVGLEYAVRDGCLWITTPSAADDADDSFGPSSPGIERMQAALDAAHDAIYEALLRETTLDLIEIPLTDVADYLADVAGIHVRIETEVVQADVGLPAEEIYVNADYSSLPIGAAVRAALRDSKLDFVVRDGYLTITSEIDAGDEVVQNDLPGRRRFETRLAELNEAVRQKLAVPSAIDVIDVPLGDFCYFIESKYDLEIRMDRPGLADVGVSEDDPISAMLDGIPLGAALRASLRDLNLDYVVLDGCLTITSADEAALARAPQSR